MEKYIYSAKNNCFVESERIDYYESCGWDLSDAVDVDDSVFEEFTRDRTVDGLMRAAGEDGLPVWADIPPRTAEELEADAESKKSSLISHATQVIAPLKDAMDGGYIEDEDKPKLTSWQKYRYALTRVDTSNPEWPESPE